MGLKAKCLFGIFQKNCSSGVSHVIVRCLLITISSSNRAPDYPTGAWTCSFFKHEHTLYVSFLSCVDHTWYGFWVLEIFLEQLRRRTLQKMVLTILPLPTTTQCEDGSPLCLCRVNYYHGSMRIPIIFKLFANNAEHRPTVCQHCWTWPNYLPSLPNCLPPLSNTDQLFSSSAKDRSTVCQSLVTSIIRLNPSSFLGFLFSFQNSVFLCFLFFTGGQLGALQLRVLEI